MTIVAPYVGELRLLKYMLNNTAASDVHLHLYTNNITPADPDILGTYIEATDVAYNISTLLGSAFTFATVGVVSTASHSDVMFSFSAAASVYGVYATDSTNNFLLFAERFSTAPFNLPSSGGSIIVSPSIQLQ